ncbi:MAG: hypothetical protein ACLS76_07595 [Eubacterium callanderi]
MAPISNKMSNKISAFPAVPHQPGMLEDPPLDRVPRALAALWHCAWARTMLA